MTTPALGLLVLQLVAPSPGGAVAPAHELGPQVAAHGAAAYPGEASVVGASVMERAALTEPGPAPSSSHWERLEWRERLWVLGTMAELTLEEKVAQLVMSYLEGGEPRPGSPQWERAERLVREEKVGGFIVGVGSSYGTASWLNRLQSWTEVPLLVSADLEWGPGTRLRGATVLPMNMAMSASGPASVAREAGRITALEARAAGIHMAFAPVADVNVNPANPVINTRSYGSDPAAVSERVVAFIEGARSAGLLTVVKHFPGHGDTEKDSHLEMPILDVDRPRLETVELRPFRAAIAAGVDGVMTAHLAVPVLDPWARPPRPATVSPPILTGLLRRQLGFGGLVVTDALHMDGVKGRGDPGAVATEAIRAGADILLIPPDEAEAIEGVVEAVRRGDLSEDRIDRSVRRVLAAKAAAGLTRDRSVNLGMLLAQVGRVDHEAWGRSVAERSITLVRGAPGALPLDVRGRSVLTVLYDDPSRHEAGAAFEMALAERGARLLSVRLHRRSGSDALERVRRMADSADLVIFASFARAVPWKGSLGLADDVAGLAAELAATGAPVLSFGDPYLLDQLPGAGTYILAWSDADVSQESAARAITGEIPITGRLPIDLPPDYRVGHGFVLPSLPGITTVRR
ncbi:MAG: glycoside hydrolase family 3 protein [Candidatus Longimicrobiales bacterium M2_2A_002]